METCNSHYHDVDLECEEHTLRMATDVNCLMVQITKGCFTHSFLLEREK